MTVTADTIPNLRPPKPAPPVLPKLTRLDRRALAGLLLGTAVLYLWNLGSVGWADIYYAGAVHAMAQDWTAFLFGSIDAGNIVTVGRPPGSLWVMALSARMFGLSSWSMLVPQALMGVAAVALLYAAARRVAGPVAGFTAGAVLALTPVAAEVFRYNNPDALLVLLLVTAAYATVRAIQTASTAWLLVAGALAGFAFLTGTAQAFVPLPALAFAYLVAAPTGFWRRVGQLLAAGIATVVAGGWWYAVVELRPPGSRPYLGGSRTDSALELALADTDLGRIFGRDPGLLRTVDPQSWVQAGWLLPTALALLLVGLWLTRRAPRTDATRASLLLWGGWTVTTALMFSLAEGHAYDTLAPGVAALVGIGGALLWDKRQTWAGRIVLAMLVAGTAAWAWLLLTRTPEFLPWLRWVVVGAGAVAVLALLVRPGAGRRGTAVTALALALATLTGPTAYAVQTVSDGGDPAPATPSAELVELLRSTGRTWSGATIGAESSAALALASDTTVMGIGGFSGSDPAPTLEEFQGIVAAGEVRWFVDQQRDPGLNSEIATWVQESFESSTVGDHTVYDLDKPTS